MQRNKQRTALRITEEDIAKEVNAATLPSLGNGKIHIRFSETACFKSV